MEEQTFLPSNGSRGGNRSSSDRSRFNRETKKFRRSDIFSSKLPAVIMRSQTVPSSLPPSTNCTRVMFVCCRRSISMCSSTFEVVLRARPPKYISLSVTSRPGGFREKISRWFARFIVETKDRNLKAQQRMERHHGQGDSTRTSHSSPATTKTITMKIAILAALVS
jgi:hypothetical protein